MAKRILYQPLPIEKINEQNNVARNCLDRAEAMLSFCQEYFGESLKDKSYLDIGAHYGYFLKFFKDHVSSVSGFESDKNNHTVSKLFYPEVSDSIKQKDFIMNSESKKYNIVSCLSVIHHYIIEEDILEPEDVIDLVDDITEDIMFFDTGEEHEPWFQGRLDGWNRDTIPEWIFNNTSFNECKPLIVDNDSTGFFEGKFGRTLFVFYRD